MLLYDPVQDALFGPAGGVGRARVLAVRVAQFCGVVAKLDWHLLRLGPSGCYGKERAWCVHVL